MRIGFFADTYYPQQNGVATSVGYFAAILKKFGHQVFVIAPKIKGYTDQEQDTLRLPSSKLWPTIPDSARLPLPIPSSVWWKIFKNDYDIIHAHGNGLFSLIGYIIAKKKNIPFVLTFHTLFNQYTHYILGGKIITPAMVDKGLRMFGNLCDGVVAPSEKMKHELIKIGIKKPISIIPNFLDIDRFTVTKKGFLHSNFHIPKERQILLSVGRLGKEKNFEFLIQTFAKINKENKQVQLVIVGEGAQKQNLTNLIKKLRLTKYVTLTDGIDIEQMPDVYKDADIFVFTSTTETQGIVTLEAAAAGLPLVLVADEAYKDIVKNNVNGFALPPKQQLFVDKIQLLLDNPTMQKAFGKASIKMVRLITKEKVLVDKIINLYKNCLKTL